MDKALIAAACHAINAAYCAAIGDDSQPAWADAPDWQKQSAIAGVEMHLANPDATPEQSHESWLAQKKADGWKYGKTKDAEKKTHPCFQSYDKLPESQKVKDYLFKATVAAFKDLPDAAAAVTTTAAPPSEVITVQPGAKLPVRYIGHRPDYIDGAFGTRTRFKKGETQFIAADIAVKMYAHKDVYEPGDQFQAVAASVAPPLHPKDKDHDPEQDVRDAVNLMGKEQLEAYARANYKVELDKRHSESDLRAEVVQLIDRFGATPD